MRPGLNDMVHVPRLDREAVDGKAIGEIIKLMPFHKVSLSVSVFDRVLVAFENDRVVCWHDEVIGVKA